MRVVRRTSASVRPRAIEAGSPLHEAQRRTGCHLEEPRSVLHAGLPSTLAKASLFLACALDLFSDGIRQLGQQIVWPDSSLSSACFLSSAISL